MLAFALHCVHEQKSPPGENKESSAPINFCTYMAGKITHRTQKKCRQGCCVCPSVSLPFKLKFRKVLWMIEIEFVLSLGPLTCSLQCERIVTEAGWPVNLSVVRIPLSASLLPKTDNYYRFAICNCPNPSSWLHWAPNDQMFHHYYGIRAELNRQMCVSLGWLLSW